MEKDKTKQALVVTSPWKHGKITPLPAVSIISPSTSPTIQNTYAILNTMTSPQPGSSISFPTLGSSIDLCHLDLIVSLRLSSTQSPYQMSVISNLLPLPSKQKQGKHQLQVIPTYPHLTNKITETVDNMNNVEPCLVRIYEKVKIV